MIVIPERCVAVAEPMSIMGVGIIEGQDYRRRSEIRGKTWRRRLDGTSVCGDPWTEDMSLAAEHCDATGWLLGDV